MADPFTIGAIAAPIASSLIGGLFNRGNSKAQSAALKGQLELAKQQLKMQQQQFNEVDFPFRKLASALMAQRANRGTPRFLPGQRQATNPYANRVAVQPQPRMANGNPRQSLAAALAAARGGPRPAAQSFGLSSGQSQLPRM